MDQKKLLNTIGGLAGFIVLTLVVIPNITANKKRNAEVRRIQEEQAAAKEAEGTEAADAATTGADASAPKRATGLPTTPFDAMAADALVADVKDLWPFTGQDDTWALYKGTAKDCDGTVLSGAPGENDFEKRDNEAKRAELRDAKVGKRYYIKQSYSHYKGRGSGDLAGDENTHYFYMALSDYDFKKQSFKFAISSGGQGLQHSGAPWSLGGPDPKWARESTEWVTSKRIGSIGGKAVDVDVVSEDRFYVDPSMVTFQWKATEEEARVWVDSSDTVVLEILSTFQGLGFHKKCDTTCMTLFGTRQCVQSNNGVGPYVRNTIDAIRVTTAGKIIYEVVEGKVTTPTSEG